MKYCVTLSYCGREYYGFQRQKNKKTVQCTIEKILSSYMGIETLIKAAGRTDTGVHAVGQTFCFETKKHLSAERFLSTMNRLLPKDIYLKSMREVDDSFDARHSCVGKVYEYRFTVLKRNPLWVGLVAHLQRDDFNFEAFLRGLEPFKGEHDFRNFTTKPEDPADFVRHVESIEARYEKDDDLVVVRFQGDGFMRYQIRLMVGTAIRVGLGKYSVEEVKASLSGIGERKIVPFKADPEGLYLMEVLY